MNRVINDINDTMLDFSAMKYKFDKYFGDTKALDKWLLKVKEALIVNTEKGTMNIFNDIALSALNELAYEEQKSLILDEKKAFISLIGQLPKFDNRYKQSIAA